MKRKEDVQFNWHLMKKYNVEPQTINKAIRDDIKIKEMIEASKKGKRSRQNIDAEVAVLEREMKEAAKELDFERAAGLRDALIELKMERGK